MVAPPPTVPTVGGVPTGADLVGGGAGRGGAGAEGARIGGVGGLVGGVPPAKPARRGGAGRGGAETPEDAMLYRRFANLVSTGLSNGEIDQKKVTHVPTDLWLV